MSSKDHLHHERHHPKHLSRSPLYHATGGEQARKTVEQNLKAPNESWLGVEPAFSSILNCGGPLDAPCSLISGHVVRGIAGTPVPGISHRDIK